MGTQAPVARAMTESGRENCLSARLPYGTPPVKLPVMGIRLLLEVYHGEASNHPLPEM